MAQGTDPNMEEGNADKQRGTDRHEGIINGETPPASMTAKLQSLYDSVSKNLSQLLLESKELAPDDTDKGKHSTESTSRPSTLPNNTWYASVKSALDSLTAASNIQPPERHQPNGSVVSSSKDSVDEESKLLSWAASAKNQLNELTHRVQNMDWVSFSSIPEQLKDAAKLNEKTESGNSIKDQLLQQIDAAQAQLNKHIDDTRVALGEAVYEILPDQLRRPWLTACAQICLEQSIHPELLQAASVRVGNGICGQETDFRHKRAERMCNDFAQFIGVPKASVDARDIPTIGIASSGGGFRAMVSTIGSYRAMHEAGLAQCIMYDAAVSGSSWAVGALHTYGCGDPNTVLDSMREAMQRGLFSTANLMTFLTENNDITQRVFANIAMRYLLSSAKTEDELVEEGKEMRAEPGDSNGISSSGNSSILNRVSDEIKCQGNWIVDRAIQESHKYLYQAEDDMKAPLTVEDLLKAAKGTLQSISAPPISIVELYGALLFKQLIVQYSRMPDGKLKLTLDPRWMKLSSQREAVDQGALPMPIYTAVRHFLGSDNNDPEKAQNHRYQWFELSPYEVGSIDHGAWVPTWAFGRPIKDGKEQFRVGETHFGSIMGTVGSAFCASVKAMTMEIYMAMPGAIRLAMDPLMDRFEHDSEISHPIPPYTLYNPFYKTKQLSVDDAELAELEGAPFLSLLDAGLENNLPFAPLLRPEREVDVIICLDSSANIDIMPWFARAEAWASNHGVERWPWGARPWTADPLRPSKSETEIASSALRSTKQVSMHIESKVKKGNMRCVVFDHPLAPAPALKTLAKRNLAPTLSILYLPLLSNPEFREPAFDPETADFCATFNEKWTAEQVDKLADLTSFNFSQEIERIRAAVKKAYERKRAFRVYMEAD
ncbi:hypothetical protein GGF37_002540 [Kickxella alabastrina]|nr:hypothetical protein GGF37_002540 [Kickxella alabastrina]